jgi:hypothetical protein
MRSLPTWSAEPEREAAEWRLDMTQICGICDTPPPGSRRSVQTATPCCGGPADASPRKQARSRKAFAQGHVLSRTWERTPSTTGIGWWRRMRSSASSPRLENPSGWRPWAHSSATCGSTEPLGRAIRRSGSCRGPVPGVHMSGRRFPPKRIRPDCPMSDKGLAHVG